MTDKKDDQIDTSKKKDEKKDEGKGSGPSSVGGSNNGPPIAWIRAVDSERGISFTESHLLSDLKRPRAKQYFICNTYAGCSLGKASETDLSQN